MKFTPNRALAIIVYLFGRQPGFPVQVLTWLRYTTPSCGLYPAIPSAFGYIECSLAQIRKLLSCISNNCGLYKGLTHCEFLSSELECSDEMNVQELDFSDNTHCSFENHTSITYRTGKNASFAPSLSAEKNKATYG